MVGGSFGFSSASIQCLVKIWQVEAVKEENEGLREQLREAIGRCVHIIRQVPNEAASAAPQRNPQPAQPQHPLPCKTRAEDAEANLSRVLEDQRAMLRRERRREREIQLGRMRAFESQLDAVVGRLRQAGEEVARATAEAEGYKVGSDGWLV